MAISQKHFPLEGGYDLVTSPIDLDPGKVILAKNYEQALKGGYSRIAGYERYDGRPKPSEAATTTDQETRRAAITAVPGEGDVLGVWVYKGDVYAVRNAVGGATAVLHKDSGSGWVAVTMSDILNFDAGITEFTVGDVVTGGTSTATADIGAVLVTSGDWSTNDAAGYLIVDNVANGPFQNNEALTDVAGGSATADGANSTLTLSPSGKYEFVNYNFFGSSDYFRMYWCDGVNKAYQYDGTYTVPITTGMPTDAPNHITAHKNFLFLSFPGGSVQHSSVTDPTSFSAVLGAGELGIGDDVSGMQTIQGGILAIYSRNSTTLLYGTSAADWELSVHSNESGAIEWTIQRMASSIYVDDRGLTSLNAVDAYGNFKDNVLSIDVQPYIDARLGTIAGSTIVKDKNQYRLFFSDKSALFFTFRDNKMYGAMPILYDHVITATCSAEDSTGREVLFFGSDNGFVYQMDSGTNFDGSAVPAWCRLAYHHYGTPTMNKRFRRIIIEMDATDSANNITLFPDFSYGDSNQPKALAQDIEIAGGGGFWGDMVWGSFTWGAQVVGEADTYIDGHGRNMGILITSNATYEATHTLHGATVDYTVLNRRR